MQHSFWIHLLIAIIVVLVYMTLFFVVARLRKRLDTVDIAWGLGFVLLAWTVLIEHYSNRSLLVAILVSIWGLRLASHIYQRSKTRGDDRRYLELSEKWKGNFWLRAYVSIFVVQAILVLVVGFPLIMIMNHQLSGWSWLVILGTILWFVGFAFESMADRQLSRFLQTKNHPKLLQTGLWRYSRHPNYFGELLQWWSIGLIATTVSYGWIGLLGPLSLTLLIIFVSGLPPIEKRRAGDPEYERYKQKTSALIPWPPKASTS